MNARLMAPKAASALLFCFSLMAIANLVQANRTVLLQPYSLNSGDMLWHGPYQFRMQEDCNLVLVKNTSPLWSSNTRGLSSPCRFTLRSDGNGVIYDRAGSVQWATGTNSQGRLFMILQCDGDVVIYDRYLHTPIWATRTGGRVETINLEEENRLRKPSNGSLISEVVPAANV